MAIPIINPKAHSCCNCAYFDFNPARKGEGGKPLRDNRECLFPGKLEVSGQECLCWKDCRSLWQRITRKYVMKAFCSDDQTKLRIRQK